MDQKGGADSSSDGSSHLQDFEILKKLGQGSQGVVYKVRRKKDMNTYVLKQISTGAMQSKQRRDCINEAILLNQLNSPYIVRYYDSFLEGNLLNIVMEFCDQGDLENFIKNQMGRPVVERKIWRFFFQIAEGLFELHSKNILHRDIKCMNIFLTSNEEIRIGDLGVAKQLSSNKSHAHNQVGTPYYMSPEILQDIPYNEKSDVWSLGCVLYQLATSKRPFEANNSTSLAMKIQKAPYTPISANYSQQLHQLIESCLTKDHLKRPSISDLLNDPDVETKAKLCGHIYSKKFQSSKSPKDQQDNYQKDKINSSNLVLFSPKAKNSTDPSDFSPVKKSPIPSFVSQFENAKLRDSQVQLLNKFIIDKEQQQDRNILRKRSSLGFEDFSQLSEKVLDTNPNPSYGSQKFIDYKLKLHQSSQRELLSKKLLTDGISTKLTTIDPYSTGFPRKVLLQPLQLNNSNIQAQRASPSQKLPNVFDPKPSSVFSKKDVSSVLRQSTLKLPIDPIFPRSNSRYSTQHIQQQYQRKDPSVKQERAIPIPSLQKEQTPISSSNQLNAELVPQRSYQQLQIPFKQILSYDRHDDSRAQMSLDRIANNRQQAESEFFGGVKKVLRINKPGSPRSNQFHSPGKSSSHSQVNKIRTRQASNSQFQNDPPEDSQIDLTTILPKYTTNPQLQKIYKQIFDQQVQKQQLAKVCIAGLGAKLYKEALRVFQEHVNRDEELSKQDHDQSQLIIDQTLKNQRDYSKHFYQIIQIENQLLILQDQLALLEHSLNS